MQISLGNKELFVIRMPMMTAGSGIIHQEMAQESTVLLDVSFGKFTRK